MTRIAALLIMSTAILAMLLVLAGCNDRSGPMSGSGPTPDTGAGGAGPPKSAGTRPVPHLTVADIQQVFWSADGKWLVTVASDTTVTVWDPAEERKAQAALAGRHTFGKPGGWGGRAAVAGDVLVDDTDQRFTVRQISTGRTVRILEQSEHAYGDQFLLTDDGKQLVALNDPRQEFNVWDVATGKLVHTKLPKIDWRVARLLGLSPDAVEAYVVVSRHHEGGMAGDPPRGVHVVNLQNGTVELRVDYNWLPASDSDRAIITRDRQCFVDDRSWDLKTGKETGQYPWRRVWAVSSDGRFVVAEEKAEGGYVRFAVWDLPAKKKLNVLPQLAFEFGVRGVAFSPDGKFLALGGRRDWGVGMAPELRNWTPRTAFFAQTRSDANFDDRVLVLYDAQTQRRVRTLAWPVLPRDSQDVPKVELPQ